MSMACGGFSKLIEECGELVEALADEAPRSSLEDEMGDVLAAAGLVARTQQLSQPAITLFWERVYAETNGLASTIVSLLTVRLGRLVQVCGKRLAYYVVDDHPDGSHLPTRLQAELGAVCGTIQALIEEAGLDGRRVAERKDRKAALFAEWDADPLNSQHAVGTREPA